MFYHEKKKKIVVFGARATGRLIYDWVHEENVVLAFVDNDSSLWGTTVSGKMVRNPESLSELDFDEIVLGTWSIGAVRDQLVQMGVAEYKINDEHVRYTMRAREVWLEDYARNVEDRGVKGNVAEAGVYLGTYAAKINAAFPNRLLYLFDTFTGFVESDKVGEDREAWVNAQFDGSSLALVKKVLPHPEKCIFKVGRFPETAKDVEDEFCFVHLDMDLFLPTLAGLRFFYPRIVNGGVIVVHDFYSSSFPGVKKAVYDFFGEAKNIAPIFPIGDGISMGIIKGHC